MGKTKAELLNKRELAALFGVSVTSVDNWLSKGCPYECKPSSDVGSGYGFNVEKVFQWRLAQDASKPANQQDPDMKKYRAARARLQAIKVEMAQLELDQQRGDLILRDVAEKTAYESGRRFRDAMMALPDSYADRLAVITDVREMREALRLMLRDAINGVAGDE